MNFEKKVKELEELVEKLDNKDLTLDEGISIYENGLKLTKECIAALSESKGRILEIKREMDALSEQPFDIDD